MNHSIINFDQEYPPTPYPDSYWVIPGRLLAGEYPADRYFEDQTRRKLDSLLDANINSWVDLTQKNELAPYLPILLREAEIYEHPVEYFQYSIENYGVPSELLMIQILDTIDAALEQNKNVYVHCWGGIGRTGTVIGCFLVRQGLNGEEALQQIKHLRRNVPDAWQRSPESDAQCSMVRSWPTEK